MPFSSPFFLFLFLPIGVGGFWLARRLAGPKATTRWLLLCSLLYCLSWGWSSLLFLLLSTAINWSFFVGIRGRRGGTPAVLLLAAALLTDIALLLMGRYGPGSHLCASLGLLCAAAPVGLSYYLFQLMALQADLWRGDGPDILDGEAVLLQQAFFPRFPAGPVVRYGEWAGQLSHRRPIGRLLPAGLFLFSTGLFKKVCIADHLAPFIHGSFAQALAGPPSASPLQTWLGLMAYSLEIYFDFSGYSDMALGLGLMVGIFLPINFFSPYKAPTIREFWRRWHISLTRLLRDYLYIPLGGSRRGTPRTLFNIMAVMTTVGAWHGLRINFLLWGLGHGLLIGAEHLLRVTSRGLGGMGRRLGRIWVFLLVSLLWVPFRMASLKETLSIYKTLAGLFTAGPGRLHLPGPLYSVIHILELPYTWLAVGSATIWLLPNSVEITGYRWEPPPRVRSMGFAAGLCAGALLWCAMKQAFGTAAHDFIYVSF